MRFRSNAAIGLSRKCLFEWSLSILFPVKVIDSSLLLAHRLVLNPICLTKIRTSLVYLAALELPPPLHYCCVTSRGGATKMQANWINFFLDTQTLTNILSKTSYNMMENGMDQTRPPVRKQISVTFGSFGTYAYLCTLSPSLQ